MEPAIWGPLFTGSEHLNEEVLKSMWNLLFLAFQWHRGNRSFVLLSLAFLCFLLYCVAQLR